MTSLGLKLGLSAQRPLGGFVGALDAYTSGLTVCWDLKRRLLSGYTGALFQVRADRTGQPTMDIPFKADGTWDTAALLTFAGADSVYVVTVYDQSGAGINLTQGTSSVQPRIVDAGVIEVGGMRFYSNQRMSTASLAYTNFASATAVQVVTKLTIQTGTPNGRVFEFGASSEISAWLPFGTDVYWDAPQATARINATLPGGTLGNEKTFSFERNGANQNIALNGSSLVSSSSKSGSISATSPFYVATDFNQAATWLGWIATVAIWNDTTNAAGRAAALA
jgi:hypothetical protein